MSERLLPAFSAGSHAVMDVLTSENVPYAIGLLIGLAGLFWWMDRWSRRGRYRQGAWIGLGGVAALGLLFAVVHLAFGDRHEAFLSMLVLSPPRLG